VSHNLNVAEGDD